MKSKTVLAVLLAMVMVAVAVASAAAASPSQAVSTDTPTETLTGTPAPSATPSPVPTTNPCVASGGTSSGGGTPVAVGTSTGGDSSEGDTSTGGNQSNPVAEALCNFFNGNLGIDLTTINTLHSSGFGYGEIAQACWMALELQKENTTGGTTPTCQQILDAKQGNDISSLNLGVSNWGQLKKLVLKNPHMNLGSVVTGRAVGLFNGTSFPGNGHGPDNGGPNGQGQGGNPGNGHGHGQGGGH